MQPNLPKDGGEASIPARFRAGTCQQVGADAIVSVVPEQTLLDHVVATTGLTAAEAARVIDDVVAYYGESVEDLVTRRHTQLKTLGAKNDEIFARIAEELAGRVVAAPRLSKRQLRRMIYG